MTPLILLVGFLGAGKTTYLRKLLPELAARGMDPHVVINDYQNARVDAELLQGLVKSVLPISGSCVCCGSREELLGALEKFEHVPGRVVIVETNGTTDSEELIELLSFEPILGRFTLPMQVSVIDGKRWQKRFWHNGLELDQARTANYLFISRMDEVDAKRVAQIEESFAKHGIGGTRANPVELAAELVDICAEVAMIPSRDVAAHGPDCECGHHHHSEDEHEHECGSECAHDHEHHGESNHEQEEHEHRHGKHHFASLQFDLPETVTRASLEKFLASMPEEVIRAKGLVRLADSPGEYHVFQKVDRSDAVQLLPIGPKSRLDTAVVVLIGPRIPEEQVRTAVADLFSAQEQAATPRAS
ncbi:MAG TPA: GTP-binding protein [Chthoniobacterales bacterium]